MKIEIDGKTYELQNPPEDVKKLVALIQITDAKAREFSTLTQIMVESKVRYVNALKQLLEKLPQSK